MTKKEQQRLLADLASERLHSRHLAQENMNLAAQVRYYKKKATQQLHLNRMQLQGLFFIPLQTIGAFVDEWYYQMECQLSDETRLKRTRNILKKHLGGPDGAAQLGEIVNLVFNHALHHLKREVENLQPEEEALFCYMTARLRNDQIGRLLNIEKLPTVSARKNRLREKICTRRPEGQDEYMALIGKKNK